LSELESIFLHCSNIFFVYMFFCYFFLIRLDYWMVGCMAGEDVFQNMQLYCSIDCLIEMRVGAGKFDCLLPIYNDNLQRQWVIH
jgi:ABC-type cobalamin transport system permease subunit